MTHSFSVPWSAIQTIFQLESDDVYKPVMSEVGIRNLINYSYTLLNFAGSPTQDLFKDRDNLDGIKCATLSNNNAFAISIRHPEKDENGNIENWQTIVIGNNVDLGDHLPEGSRYIMQPVFVLSGQITEDGEDFLIRDMKCQLPTDAQGTMVNWALPTDQNDAQAMLMYGSRALTYLIQTNKPLDLKALETTLHPDKYNLKKEFSAARQNPVSKIDYAALRQAFQLNNTEYFDENNPSLNDPEIINSAAIFQKLGMSAGKHLKEGSPVQTVTTYTHHKNDNGQLIIFLEYELPNNTRENTRHLAAVFVEIETNQQNNLTYLVYAAFDGQVIEDTFVPTAMRYRQDKSIIVAIGMNNPNEIQAAWWYIDDVFVSMLAECDIAVTELVQRMNPEELMYATEHFGYMFSRNEQQLVDDITRVQMEQHERLNSFTGATKNYGGIIVTLNDGRRFRSPSCGNGAWIPYPLLN